MSSQSELKVTSSAARPVHWLSLWKHMTYIQFVLSQGPKLFMTFHIELVLETQMQLQKLSLMSSQSEFKAMSPAARPVHWLSLWKHMTYKKFVLSQSQKLFMTNFQRTTSQSLKHKCNLISGTMNQQIFLISSSPRYYGIDCRSSEGSSLIRGNSEPLKSNPVPVLPPPG